MAIVMARFETAHASKYLEQLCRHLAPRVPVKWSNDKASVHFIPGTARLEVRDGALMLACDAETDDKLAILVKLVESHVQRLAVKESITLVWLKDGRPADALNARIRAMSELSGKSWDDDEDDDTPRPTIH